MGIDVAVALGGNIGSQEIIVARMQGVLDAFRTQKASNLMVSRVFQTKPFQTEEGQDWYLNCVFHYQALEGEPPLSFLEWTKELEKELGRENKGDLQPRTMDIDVLWIGKGVLQRKELTLPHPKIKERRFVLEPLLDIYPKNFKQEHLGDSLSNLFLESPKESVVPLGWLLQ